MTIGRVCRLVAFVSYKQNAKTSTKAFKASKCCGAKIWASLGDGVLMGTCSKCMKTVCQVNPKSGKQEWL